MVETRWLGKIIASAKVRRLISQKGNTWLGMVTPIAHISTCFGDTSVGVGSQNVVDAPTTIAHEIIRQKRRISLC